MPTLKKNSSIKELLRPVMRPAWSPTSLMVLTSAIAALYILMEWIFLFTRPSFLQTIAFLQKFLALSTASGLLVLACGLALLPFLASGQVFQQAAFRKMLTLTAMLLPAFLLAALTLLLLDNFTYTIFQLGIISTRDWIRGLYGVLFSLLVVYLYFKLVAFHHLLAAFFSRWKPAQRLMLVGSIFLLSLASAGIPALSMNNQLFGPSHFRPAGSRSIPPDILLITVDGVNAEYTSLDAYERDTTPFLRAISAESLRARNAFANAQGTIGSITTLLTGKYPMDTRVIYSSDLLQGEDAYQHLPEILEDFGYYTVQLSNPVYADAYKTNFQNAFNEANGRSADQQPLAFALARIYPGINYLFQQEMTDRLSDRLGHIFFLSDMSNPYEQVTEAAVKFNDWEKIDYLFRLLEESRQPVFVHLHWMGTHGPRYFPDKQVFSAGISVDEQGNNNQLFYYDAILEFDQAVEEIYARLEKSNQLENTLLVVTSDHSQKWTNSRLPLLIRFPRAAHQGVLDQNVSTVDIAPTLLDYLGIKTPKWMAGQSLLSPSYIERPIFTARIPKSSKDPVTGKVIYPESEPPFFQFGRISVIVCDQWYDLDLVEMSMTHGNITAYATPCSAQINESQALELIMQHLQCYDFDTDTLLPLRARLEGEHP